jgi:Heparinase II/III-like protein/Heparinase II/III N-terminus
MTRFSLAYKALRELGPKSLTQYAIYKFGLATGHYHRLTPEPSPWEGGSVEPIFPIPSREELLKVLGEDGKARLLVEAEEILARQVRLFGGDLRPLKLSSEGMLPHWTDYEMGKIPFPSAEFNDVKFIWEPARFGWAFTLGRAYYISGDGRFAHSFWNYTDEFIESNPPYRGPQWASGQEVAIRLMALAWAGQIFSSSPESTPQRMKRLAAVIAAHAGRIPPTLVYARSQNNNHLLVEAAGLYTAALALPEHPNSESWRATGWKWLEWAFKKQIYKDGSYVQHSANYHRLVLQAALWVWTLANLSPARRGGTPQKIEAQLTLAANWLAALTDKETGQAANLGANDGAYIFPLTVCPFSDFRPVVQAASLAFAGEKPFKNGPWNEMALWFGQKLTLIERFAQVKGQPQKFVLRSRNSWAYFRAIKFRSRPSHADQLHLDLWWRGINFARDAGTYLYNADPPWNNSLTATQLHNTVTVNGREQMTRAGRFLYLDWALAGIVESGSTDEAQHAVARGHGYRTLGIIHQRTVTAFAGDRWMVEDEMMLNGSNRSVNNYRLHWLLPDWEWKLDPQGSHIELQLKSPLGWVILSVTSSLGKASTTLVRAGERLQGEGLVSPIVGWYSPTYAQKEPGLSFAVEASGAGTVKFTTEFTFPQL